MKSLRTRSCSSRLLTFTTEMWTTSNLWVGMLAEDHLPAVPSGVTIRAGLEEQFTRLAVGDRFFYQWDPDLTMIEDLYGITVSTRLADLMLRNTSIPASSIQNADNVMFAQIPEPSTASLLITAVVGLTLLRMTKSEITSTRHR